MYPKYLLLHDEEEKELRTSIFVYSHCSNQFKIDIYWDFYF